MYVHLTHRESAQNCTIAGHALDGVTMLGTDSAVLDSRIHDCGCAGIRAHGGNGTTLDPGNLQILRNSITNVAQWKRTYSPGIHWGGVNNTCRLRVTRMLIRSLN
jgi:hypothetical protein